TVQPRHLDAALALVTEVIRAPAFPAKELLRLQGEHVSDRLQALTEPRALADLATQWCVYDASARYRRPISGTTATVNALETDAVRRFWASRYTPGTLTVVMTGEVDPAAAERAAARLVADWVAAEPPPVDVTTGARQTTPMLH